MLIDTHTHLYVPKFDQDRDEVIARAVAAGVEQFYLPNIDSTTIEGMLDLEKQYPQRCFAMMGLHPCSVGANVEEELAIVKEWLDRRPFIAVGEIGMDLYWDKTYQREQEMAFLRQANWALEKNIPIVIHSRESTDELIELLQEFRGSGLRGVFHCFTGTYEQAEQIIDLGFFLELGGVLTFKNSGLDKNIEKVPLEFLVLETDSPYLAPVPRRGKRNESQYVTYVAAKLAEIKGLTAAEIAAKTSQNAQKIFGIPAKV